MTWDEVPITGHRGTACLCAKHSLFLLLFWVFSHILFSTLFLLKNEQQCVCVCACLWTFKHGHAIADNPVTTSLLVSSGPGVEIGDRRCALKNLAGGAHERGTNGRITWRKVEEVRQTSSSS